MPKLGGMIRYGIPEYRLPKEVLAWEIQGILDLGVEHRLLQKSGSWYSYGDTRIGQGREAARQFLSDNPEVAGEIEVKLREKLGLLPVGGGAAAKETEEATK